MRRTCSLTMVAENVNINDFYWGLNTKVKIEIGLKNKVDSNLYGDIIWFPQGVYVLTSFSTSYSASSYTISLSGKDKMCLLNGDVGGNITATTDFGQYEQLDENDVRTIIKYPIKDIIRDSVHQYGREPFHNIVIKDVDDLGLELLEYRYDKPMYLIRNAEDDTYFNFTLDGNLRCFIVQPDGSSIQSVISDSEHIIYDPLVSSLIGEQIATQVYFSVGDPQHYCIAKISYGETAGYRTTDLTFAGDLISQVGETLTSMLDKIVDMLGDFEYFYDLDGRFVFQRQHTYVNTTPSLIKTPDDDGKYIDNLAISSTSIYTFTNSNLITSFNNTPNLMNARNDFAVWGTRKGAGGGDIPIHMRYAIDEKPFRYVSIDGTIYTTEGETAKIYDKIPTFDDDWWRIDDWAEYYKLLTGHYPTGIMKSYAPGASDAYPISELLKHFELAEGAYGWEPSDYVHVINVDTSGKLMFNQHGTNCNHNFPYFLDLMAQSPPVTSYIYRPYIPKEELPINNGLDWRELIYQMAKDYRAYNHGIPEFIDPRQPDFEVKLAERNAPLFPNGVTGYEPYYIDMEGFWRDLYNPDLDKDNEDYVNYYSPSDAEYATHPELLFWSKTVYESPQSLNFWIDFLDTGDLIHLSNRMIGNRPKAVKDQNVKSIYYRETPMIIFSTPEKMTTEERKSGYRYFQVQDIDQMFSISTQGISAKDKVDNLVYDFGYCNETVSVTAVPIYYLEPNTRIEIFDDKSGINGEYILQKITIPLTYNGTMNLTAAKAADSIDGRRIIAENG